MSEERRLTPPPSPLPPMSRSERLMMDTWSRHVAKKQEEEQEVADYVAELERDAERWRECVRLESVAKSFGVTLPQALIVWGMDKAAFTDSIDASIAAQKKVGG